MIRVAAVQMTSGPEVADNLNVAAGLIADAADGGARLIVLPENFAFMGKNDSERLRVAETPGDGPMQEFLSTQGRETGAWIVGGTIPILTPDHDKLWSATLVYDDQGSQVARYDKIHLFDVSIPERDERYHESEKTEPGHEVIVVATPFGRLGLSVCYDLRFPEMFRRMQAEDIELIAVPAAFTATTGRAHWEVLLRARAIENLCFVVAAAQGGMHPNGRETNGDSMIVDPWGIVLERKEAGVGVVVADIDSEEQVKIRRDFPALSHRRM